MAKLDPESYFSRCPASETCFAGDREAYKSMSHVGDMGITAAFQNMAEAAYAAGQMGLPLEDVRYTKVRIEEEETDWYSDDFGIPHEYSIGRIGSEEVPGTLKEPSADADYIEKMMWRIAKCSHACGATAVGCPLRTPPAEA